jgi:type II secretory pathway pseudopilin PulG
LVELLVAVVIIALLITLSFPLYGVIRRKMEFAGCVANLRGLHAGFNTYMQDHGMVWPQPPPGAAEEESSEEDWTWWYNELKPYGINRKTWICPGDRDGKELNEAQPETLNSSYTPTQFDEVPNSPFRWNTPWLIERGPNHGYKQGPNMVMPDGQVIQGIGLPIEAP